MNGERITESPSWRDPRGQEMKTPDDVAEMLRLKACGWGLKRIARQLGCSHHTVKAYVAAGGVKPFKSPERRTLLDGLESWLRERFIRHRGNADVVRQDLLAEKGVAVAGTEREFAALMTQKAQTLGMTNTVYVNASGLPADAQITTAREQALLGRTIQERFPEYYRYFALPSFQYRGMSISNHNALLRQMEGVDGIKTGYTEASGYNLVSSVRREGRHLVAVVLGGRSTGSRDSRMRQLILDFIHRASPTRTAPAILEATEPTTETPSKTALPLPAPDNEPQPNAMPAPAPQEPAAVSLEHAP
jgi:hypothetical protein